MTTHMHETDWNGQYDAADRRFEENFQLAPVPPEGEVARGGMEKILSWRQRPQEEVALYPPVETGADMLG